MITAISSAVIIMCWESSVLTCGSALSFLRKHFKHLVRHDHATKIRHSEDLCVSYFTDENNRRDHNSAITAMRSVTHRPGEIAGKESVMNMPARGPRKAARSADPGLYT